MLQSSLQRIELTARRSLPLVSTLFLVLMSSVSWPLPYFGAVVPSLGLIAVYYWSIHRPDLFTPLAAFLLGLVFDIIHFLPVGLSAFVFVAMHQLVLSQRRFFVGHAFFMLWTGFAVIMMIVMLGHWLILSAFDGHWLSFLPILLQGVLTMAIFPLVALALIAFQRYLLTQV